MNRLPLGQEREHSNRSLEYELQRLLTINQAASPIYKNGLANHLPMTLIAMYRLGANEEQLHRFFNYYQPRLESIGSVYGDGSGPTVIDGYNWSNDDFLGDRTLFPFYLAYFKDQLTQYSTATVLNAHLYTLAEGISTSAFHAIIRLGYGIEIQDKTEVAYALAYWASEFQSLGTIESEINEQLISASRFIDVINRICSNGNLANKTIKAPNIIVRLDKVANLADFDRIRHLIKNSRIGFNEIESFVIQLFFSCNDFTALHMVTSCFALKKIMSCLNQTNQFEVERKQGTLLKYYALALSAAYISIKTPDFNVTLPNHTDCRWRLLSNIALNSNEDHHIKCLYTCLEQYKLTGDQRYYYCAYNQIHSPETDITDIKLPTIN